MLLAIPTVAAVKILVVHYWDTRMVWPPRGPDADELGARHGPDVPDEPDMAGPESDPGPAMVAVLPEDDPLLQEAAASGNGEPSASPAEDAEGPDEAATAGKPRGGRGA
jgi:hypothetical protein